jgi:DNA polymerase-3 subunit epsilon
MRVKFHQDIRIILKSKGADIDTGVTKRTRYVIVGKGAGPIKLKKIKEFNSKGACIKILNEATFIKMIK